MIDIHGVSIPKDSDQKQTIDHVHGQPQWQQNPFLEFGFQISGTDHDEDQIKSDGVMDQSRNRHRIEKGNVLPDKVGIHDRQDAAKKPDIGDRVENGAVLLADKNSDRKRETACSAEGPRKKRNPAVSQYGDAGSIP